MGPVAQFACLERDEGLHSRGPSWKKQTHRRAPFPCRRSTGNRMHGFQRDLQERIRHLAASPLAARSDL